MVETALRNSSSRSRLTDHTRVTSRLRRVGAYSPAYVAVPGTQVAAVQALPIDGCEPQCHFCDGPESD